MKVNTKVRRKVYLKRVKNCDIDLCEGCYFSGTNAKECNRKSRRVFWCVNYPYNDNSDYGAYIFVKSKTVTTVELTEVH